MSLIGKKIEEFNAQAYHQGEFLEIRRKTLWGIGASYVSTQQISLLFAPLN